MSATTDTDTNATLARRVCEQVFGDGRLDLLPEIVSEDYLNHNRPPGMSPGRRGLAEVVQMVRAGFPDFRYTVERVLARDDEVVIHVTAQGTHDGPLFGSVPATGRRATWSEMHWMRVRDGLLAEHWGCRDDLGMLRQLGLAPDGG